jgi:hypothetical protein
MENTYGTKSCLYVAAFYRSVGKSLILTVSLIWPGLGWALPGTTVPPPPPRVATVKPSTGGSVKVKSNGGSKGGAAKGAAGQRVSKSKSRRGAGKQTDAEQTGSGSGSIREAKHRSKTTRPASVPSEARNTTSAGGATTYSMRDGRQWELDGDLRKVRFSKPGMDATFLPNGQIRTATVSRRDGTTILLNRTTGGVRTAAIAGPNGVRVVSLGAHAGYIQRPLASGFVARTYVNGGTASVAVYRPTVYRGATYYTYVPRFYYTSSFYTWAYASGMSPLTFAWGWGGEPWFASYGGYLGLSSSYRNPALWMTDFVLAQDLMSAFADRSGQPDGAPSGHRTEATDEPPADAVSPLVKSDIANEVRQELATEQAEAADGIASPAGSEDVLPALDPTRPIFVISSDLRVAADGAVCALTPGDVIARTSTSVDDDGTVAVKVIGSKPGDCPVDSATAVSLAALQEMHNQFRHDIDSGLAELSRQQGRHGVPAAGPVGAVEPDHNAERELRKAQKAASEADDDITRASAAN